MTKRLSPLTFSYNTRVKKIPEFESIAKGGKFLSQEERGLVISLGTGTAMVIFDGCDWEHIRGTGLGGGTFMGLGKALLQTENFPTTRQYRFAMKFR